MSGDVPSWLLAVLIAVCGLVFAVVAWDMRRLPRLYAARRVIAAAEQACFDHDFNTITQRLEQQ